MKFSQLKFLTDENISPKITTYLRSAGFTVLDVKEEGWQGRNDSFLLEQSVEESYFIITHDSDFGRLAVNQGQPFYGLLYIRLKNITSTHVIGKLDEVLSLDPEVTVRTILVVSDRKVRIRHR